MSQNKNKTSKNELKDKHLNKTKLNLKHNKIAEILEYIDESFFCLLILILLLHMNVVIKYFLYLKLYIILRVVNFIFSLQIFSKFTKVLKMLSLFLMLYDNFIKMFYLIMIICIDFMYIRTANFNIMPLDQNSNLLFYVFTTVLIIYLLAFFHILFLYLKTFYLNSKDIKKYFIHSFMSKLIILCFLYLISLTYVLCLLPSKTFMFYFYFFSLCYIALSLIIPLFFYKRMCLDRRFFLDILFKFYLKLFCVFLFNCGVLFELVIVSDEQKKLIFSSLIKI